MIHGLPNAGSCAWCYESSLVKSLGHPIALLVRGCTIPQMSIVLRYTFIRIMEKDFMTETKRTPNMPREVPKARAIASLQSGSALGVVVPANELNGPI